jgi:hypothetical protein
MQDKFLRYIITVFVVILFGGAAYYTFRRPAPVVEEAVVTVPEEVVVDEPIVAESIATSVATSPYIDALLTTSTLSASSTELTGMASGTWYFEASFPIEVRDTSNQLLETLIATATTAWMTTALVPFTAPFVAANYSGQTIKFILKKDNPSGEPANDGSITISGITIP